MPTIRQVRSDEWERLREVRLEALRDAPYAFHSKLEEAKTLPDEEWQTRTKNGAAGTRSVCALAIEGDRAVGSQPASLTTPPTTWHISYRCGFTKPIVVRPWAPSSSTSSRRGQPHVVPQVFSPESLKGMTAPFDSMRRLGFYPTMAKSTQKWTDAKPCSGNACLRIQS
jgi:hypothetical protein